MIYGKEEFKFKAADFYPFKDQSEIDRVRAITKEDILAMNGKHPTSPSMSVNVIKNEEFEMIMLTDMVKRIIDSDRYDQKVVMIMCNPCPTYRKVAYMLRELGVNCRNVKFYMMDEWADEDGNIAPLSYKAGFGNAFYRFMVSGILDLGFKEEQVYTTMELRMKCGIGKCGRCNIGNKYVCKDGPVFRFDELDELPNEY